MADISSVTLPAAGDQGELHRFRNVFYDCISAWPDALFELLDAVCNPDVVDAIRYVMRTGCQWDALPVDFPPHPLVKHYFTAWTRDGTLGRLHHSLREQVRQIEGRTADPSAALVDSQAVRAAETVSRASRGFDAGRRVNGCKRHIVTDTCGWLLAVAVTGAGVQDRDAGRLLLWIVRTVFPTVRLVDTVPVRAR